MEIKINKSSSFFQKTLIGILGFSALTASVVSMRYLFMGADGISVLADTDDLLSIFSQQKIRFWHDFVDQQKTAYHENVFVLLVHIIGMSVALSLGIYQLTPYFRQLNPGLHRIFGYIYSVSSLIGLSSGAFISIALPMVGGISAIIPNIIGATIGILSIIFGIISIRQGLRQAHEKWMLRSYAVVSTLLTLYTLIAVFALFHLSPETGYKIAHLLCLPINIIIAEYIIAKKFKNNK